MENINNGKINHFNNYLKNNFRKMYGQPFYKILLILTGIPTFLILLLNKIFCSNNDLYLKLEKNLIEKYEKENLREKVYSSVLNSERRKIELLNIKISEKELLSKIDKIVKRKLSKIYKEEIQILEKNSNVKKNNLINIYYNLLDNKFFLFFSIVSSFLMYAIIYVFSKPILKYINERIFMMLFVIVGVLVLVFTILYLSPLDPAKNILGEQATPEKVAEFERIYGLDKSYIEQLYNTFKKFVTFDLGTSYVGNENVFKAIAGRFPVTLQLTFLSLFIGVIIAIPAGIISAIKQYSSFDYCFMFLALLGLSLPNFWLGLVMILNFSIKLDWLPAMYDVNNILTLIMPAIVLGTDLAATCARMTRSSMLEVKNQDYVLTARAKGLSEKRVILKHVLGNAMIPIVTVIGLQFGGLLGGSATTEKVFNVNGLGNYIVEKQFVPDVPVVLAGVVYISIVVSLVNLIVDIMYAFLDPRIKSKIKNY